MTEIKPCEFARLESAAFCQKISGVHLIRNRRSRRYCVYATICARISARITSEWDANLGLNHFGDRWQDPVNGRWISRDPIGFAAGDPNLYRFADNDPVSFTDPTGDTSTLLSMLYGNVVSDFHQQFNQLLQTGLDLTSWAHASSNGLNINYSSPVSGFFGFDGNGTVTANVPFGGGPVTGTAMINLSDGITTVDTTASSGASGITATAHMVVNSTGLYLNGNASVTAPPGGPISTALAFQGNLGDVNFGGALNSTGSEITSSSFQIGTDIAGADVAGIFQQNGSNTTFRLKVTVPGPFAPWFSGSVGSHQRPSIGFGLSGKLSW
jgi:RHS repeat-associated protein